jgi:glycosyltransferase involved in cell wall biosynthesis
MACQKPALTSNKAYTGVFGDYAKDLMFLQGDHLDLAEKINGLLNRDEKQRSNLGVHLRKIVETEHSINHLMDQLIAIFKMCTG